MDPLPTSVRVLTIATAGFQLASKLSYVADQVKGAPKTIADAAQDMTSLSQSMQKLGEELKKNKYHAYDYRKSRDSITKEMGAEKIVDLPVPDDDWLTGTPAKMISYWVDDSSRPPLSGSTMGTDDRGRRDDVQELIAEAESGSSSTLRVVQND